MPIYIVIHSSMIITKVMTHSVNILEVVRVVPPPSESLTLPLTYFDLCWLKLHPVDRVIFYKAPELTSSSSLVPKLKSSLSATLLHYLPLAGRLVWDDASHTKPAIVYSRDENDAVYFTVAESNGDISCLAGDQPRYATEYHSLVPVLQSSDESAQVLAVQITIFPNQGFCLGVTVHHAVSDGKTTAMFLKAWAHKCKHEQEDDALPHDLIPFMDRTSIQDPTGVETKLLNNWIAASNNKPSLKLFPSKEIGPDIIRVTHRLTPDNIQKLRELVKTKSSSSQLRLSTFVITYAYVITCMVKARGGESNRLVCIIFASDFRTQLNPPLPSTFFGNCIVGSGDFDFKAEPILEGEGKGFVSVVESVSEWVNGLSLEKVEESPLSLVEAFKRMEPGRQIISVSGSTRLGMYETDFGWGKPVKVEIVTIDETGAVSLSESGDGTGGVEIGICLKKDEAERFGSLFSHGLQ